MSSSGASSSGSAFGAYAPTGEAELVRSCVLFLDVLGVEAGACGEERLDFLRRLRQALREARTSVGIEHQKLHVRALFSDSLIAGFPLVGGLEPAEVIGPAEVMAARLQLELIKRGFFLRGGLSFGEHYMDEDLAFGPALVEAAVLERKALMPRVVLSKSAAAAERKVLDRLQDSDDSPQRQYLLIDADVTFISYLDVVIDVSHDEETRDALAQHRDAVLQKLREHAGQPAIEAKYLWVARYHNFVCRERAPKSLGCDHLIELDSQISGFESFGSDTSELFSQLVE